MLIDYLHTNPHVAIRYHAIDMILKVVSEAEAMTFLMVWKKTLMRPFF